MKTQLKLLLAGTLILAAAGAGIFASENSGQSGPTTTVAAPAGKTLYTCGMHPWIIQDHPGDCPVCGMKLEPVHQTSTAMSSAISIDPATVQMMNLQTTKISSGPLRRTIRTVGTIDYNETALADVTTKFKGWIEKLDVDATGELVHRGEPLFEIYSPELYSAEAEYLAISGTNRDSNSAALRELTLDKLKFFDVSDAQIDALEKSGEVRKTLEVLAPMDGFVVEKNAVQGQMVDAGMRLYRLADLGIVWVVAQIYEQDLAYLQLGQEAMVKVASMPDREFRGRVTFIYPSMDEKTRTARVRLEFENPGYFLKPGMFVSAEIKAELGGSAVLVPDSAVLRSGGRNTVFVALEGGKFEARDVTLGVDAENSFCQVLNGLNAGERVVTSGQFLLDSESQLREAIEKMHGPATAGIETSKRETIETGTNSTNQSSNNSTPETTVYVCPMPEHVSIIYDHAGNCPICGMALVPVTRSELQKIQPGGKVLYYTCPMPEHASVHQDKPGKCPLCGMTLIPVMAQPDADSSIQKFNNPAIPGATASPASSNTNSSASNKQPVKQLYTCPMHPDVISDKRGKCPKCGMELVPLIEK